MGVSGCPWAPMSVLLVGLCSFLGLFGFAFIYNALLLETPLVPDPYFVMQQTAADANFWLLLVLAPAVAVLPRFLVKCVAVCRCEQRSGSC